MIRLFLLLCFLIPSAHALVLEDLIQNGELETKLKNKKIGYYIGSFDPPHKGHEAVAQLSVEQGLCDFVIIYPAWGGDSYKTRAPVSHRTDMLFSIFQNDPTVIVTRLNPGQMQAALTVPDPSKTVNQKPAVKPAFTGMKFTGLIGSDTALSLHNNTRALAGFMTGINIPEQYKNHTIGGLMALPAKNFVVFLREGDNLTQLESKIGNRPIIKIIENTQVQNVSSTAVKKAWRNDKPIDKIVSEPILKIMNERGLYQIEKIDSLSQLENVEDSIKVINCR